MLKFKVKIEKWFSLASSGAMPSIFLRIQLTAVVNYEGLKIDALGLVGKGKGWIGRIRRLLDWV